MLLVQYLKIYASVPPVRYMHGNENQNYRVLKQAVALSRLKKKKKQGVTQHLDFVLGLSYPCQL